METIDKENLSKDDYLAKIMGMTLNTSVDEILEILNFVESNYIYWKLFFNNLYVLIEKEKYLKANFNAEPKLYPRLSDKTKAILEEAFVNGLNEYGDQESNSIREELKSLGYENVLDRRCQRFFDKCEFENRQTFDLDEGKCHAYFDSTGKGWDNMLAKNFIVKVSSRDDLHFLPRKKCKDDKAYKFNNLQLRVDTDVERYFVQNNAVCSGGSIKRYVIDRNTGECTRIPRWMNNFPQYALGYYIKKYWSPSGCGFAFYDERFSKVFTIHRQEKIYIDYRLEVFITYQDNKATIYDKKFNVVNKIEFGKEYNGYELVSANDGIMVLSHFGKRELIYYDYINMRQIDLFNCGGNYTEHLAYNEGVYNCIDDNRNHCYKKLDGKIIIDQIQDIAYPFLGNIAKVGNGNKMLGSEEFFIDRTGKYTSKEDVLSKLYESELERYGDCSEYIVGCVYPYLEDSKKYGDVRFNADLKSGRYQVIYQPRGNHWKTNVGCIVTQDNYVVNDDTPIVKINFEGKNKCFEKVNPMD